MSSAVEWGYAPGPGEDRTGVRIISLRAQDPEMFFFFFFFTLTVGQLPRNMEQTLEAPEVKKKKSLQ